MVFAFLTQTLDKFDIISNQNVTPDEKAPIKVQLNKATDSGVVDVPKDLFEGILEASNDGQSRRAIMMHLFECFTQSTKAKHLRKPYLRIHAALILTEELILKGSPALVSEIASGYHFDLLQQLSFLEQFHWTADPRAQALVRSKAQSVRRTVAPKLEGAEVIQDKGDLSEDTASTCSGADERAPITHDLLEAVQGEWRTKRGTEMKVNGSEVSGFINASLVVEGEFLYLHFPNDEKEYYAYLRADDGILCWSDGDFWRRPQDKSFRREEEEEQWHGVLLPPKNPSNSSAKASAKTVIHGIACVGHSSDTETESSADETSSQGQRRGQRRMKTRKERTENSSRTSSQSPRQAATPQDVLDLLS